MKRKTTQRLSWLKSNQGFLFLTAIIFLGFLPRLYFLFAEKRILWDSAVYIGIGKFIFSWGAQGIWESLRPLGWPLILGFFWKLGFPIVFFSKLISLAFSIGLIFLTYKVGERLHEWTGLVAAAFVSFAPFLIFYEHWGLSEIPSAFFGLLAIYLFLNKKYAGSGLIAGFAFMTKFPNGLVFGALLVALFYKDFFELKNKAKFFVGFMIPTIAYLILNAFLYDHPFIPFFIGNEVINTAGLWLYDHGVRFYFVELIKENFIFIFAPLGIYYFLKSKRQTHAAVLFLFALLFAYFTYMPHKEIRFAILFLPYLAIITAYGFTKTLKSANRIQVFTIVLLILFLFAQQFKDKMTLYDGVEGTPDAHLIETYYKYLDNRQIEGEVWVSDPKFALYTNNHLELVYYPVFNAKYINNINQEFLRRDIHYVFLNSCDIVCAPKDTACEREKAHFMDFISDLFIKRESITRGTCKYMVFEHRNK